MATTHLLKNIPSVKDPDPNIELKLRQSTTGLAGVQVIGYENKSAPVVEAIARIEDQAERVVHQVRRLQNAIEPVLRSGPGWGDSESEAWESTGVPLADRLYETAGLLGELAEHLAEVTDRVAL